MDPVFYTQDLYNQSGANIDVQNAIAINTSTLNVSGNANFSYLTPNSIVTTDASDNITTQNLLAGQVLIGQTGLGPKPNYLTGTTHQVIVTPSSGAITLSTPQNIDTTSDPTFNTLSLTQKTNQLVLSNGATITITTSPAGSYTLSIPDPGISSNFILQDSILSQKVNSTFLFNALTANSVLYLNSSKAVSSQALTNGQLFIGSTGNIPSAANLTSSDSSIAITNGPGTIDLKCNSSGTGSFSSIITTAGTSGSGYVDHWKLETTGLKRWAWELFGSESIGNAGSDLYLNAYADDGSTFLRNAISFIRSSGNCFIQSNLSIPLGTTLTFGLTTSNIQQIISSAPGGGIVEQYTLGHTDTISRGDTFALLATTQTLTNKTVLDNTYAIAGNADTSKKVKWNLASSTSGTTLTLNSSNTTNKSLTYPDFNDTFAVLAGAQTLTNKTLLDTTTTFANNSDTSKKIIFDISGNTTGKKLTLASAVTLDRTITFPDATCVVVGDTNTQNVSNKAITASTFSYTGNTGASIPYTININTDTQPRYYQFCSGNQHWGDGSVSGGDTRFYRSAASTLTLDNGSGGTGSLQFGNSTTSYTPASLNYYETNSFTSNFSGPYSATSFTLRIKRIGDIVMISFPALTALGNNSPSSITNATAIPARFRPVINQNYIIPCTPDGTIQRSGSLVINTAGTITIFSKDDFATLFQGVLTLGLFATCLTYPSA